MVILKSTSALEGYKEDLRVTFSTTLNFIILLDGLAELFSYRLLLLILPVY
jgi:hypothetical protein